MLPDESSRVVAALFDSSYGFFVRLVARRTGSLALAEELVQEALAALYEELRRERVVREPRAWVAAVLYRMLAKDHHRRHREAAAIREMASLQGDASGEPAGERLEGDLEQLLEALTPREREVVLLRADSRKYREIALLLGISKNSVNTLLARALKKLHAAAKGEWPARPARDAVRTVRGPLQ